MIQKREPQEGDLRTIDGHEEYFANGYWMRHYPPLQYDDLQGALKLVNTFELRFQKAVEFGMEASPDDARIDTQRKLYEAAKTKRESLDDPHSPDYKRAEAEEHVFGGMLAVSLFRRAVSHIKDHLNVRIHNIDDANMTDGIRKSIDADLMESYKLFGYVRRAGGGKDIDGVLNEMRGEPVNVLAVTMRLPKEEEPLSKKEEPFDFYHRHHYQKLASALRNIDDATVAIKKLVNSSSTLKRSALPAMIDEFRESAKTRLQLRLSDQPDYDLAAGHLRASRNAIRDFDPEEMTSGRLAALNRKSDKKILSQVQEYRKLVYDIAHVRVPMQKSTTYLIETINRLQGPGVAQAAG